MPVKEKCIAVLDAYSKVDRDAALLRMNMPEENDITVTLALRLAESAASLSRKSSILARKLLLDKKL